MIKSTMNIKSSSKKSNITALFWQVKRWSERSSKKSSQRFKSSIKSERKTQIIAAEGEVQMEDLIANEQVIITISEDDYIKRMPVDTFREQRRGGQGVTGCSSSGKKMSSKGFMWPLRMIICSFLPILGRCYWLKVWQIPETGTEIERETSHQFAGRFKTGRKNRHDLACLFF